MLRIVEETIEAATPHFLGVDALGGLPEPDPGRSVEYLRIVCEKGIADISLVMSLMFVLLNLYTLLLKRHTFPHLDYDTQSDLMERLFDVNIGVLKGLFQIMSTPIVMAYYCRADVQKALGFDIVALKEESNLRRVTREGGPLPPKTGAAAADDNTASIPGQEATGDDEKEGPGAAPYQEKQT